MKMFQIIATLLALNTGLAVADDFTETNQMPSPLQTLMETVGHVQVQRNLVLAPPDTNSLRNLPPIKKSEIVPLERPLRKPHWNFWDNTDVKYIHRNNDQNVFGPAQFTPYSALAQFEYDINYTFNF